MGKIKSIKESQIRNIRITHSGIKVRNYGNVKFRGNTAIIGGDYVAYTGSTTQVGFKNAVKVLGTIRIENANISILSNDYITKNETSTIMEAQSIEGNISKVETNGMRTANAEIKDGKIVAVCFCRKLKFHLYQVQSNIAMETNSSPD